jgi:hypothetical protein
VKSVKGRPKAKKKLRTRKVSLPSEPPSYELEPLDPWLNCGPDTTVTELWKVRERQGAERRIHLVYFDRYGWYCEHGRSCPAVAEVRKVVRTMSANAPRPQGSGKPRARKRK